MSYRIAIHPDDNGPRNSSAPRWREWFERRGCDVSYVDVTSSDIVETMRGFHAFMWRWGHYSNPRQIARRILPTFEHALGLVVYPDQATGWHFDDKVAQKYLLEAKGVPAPRSWVFWDRERALAWAETASYPLVLKLSGGAGSSNVRLVQSPREATHYVRMLFGRGVTSLPNAPAARIRLDTRIKIALQQVAQAARLIPEPPNHCWELHKNYVFFQEFLPNNDYDTRVTVIGDRAFAFRRMNRPGDFRASGSGRLVYDPGKIDLETVKLAFETASKLGAQSCAIDGMLRGSERVVGEVSYTYMSGAVYDCPGHWDRSLRWHEGHLWPEDAHAEDLYVRIRERFGSA